MEKLDTKSCASSKQNSSKSHNMHETYLFSLLKLQLTPSRIFKVNWKGRDSPIDAIYFPYLNLHLQITSEYNPFIS
jgi:hypothetical protein